jgi:protein-tyrosine phosphatase
MSVTGEFGAAAKNCAESLLRHKCVHFIATDTHRPDRRPPILSRGRDAAAKIIGAEAAAKLVQDNPLRVVNGELLEIEEHIPYSSSKRSFFGRLFK